MTPEQKARVSIDTLLQQAGWHLCSMVKANKHRALIQMTTGSGKTFTSIRFISSLIKFAAAKRVLFLVDRGNLGHQTKKEFDQYISSYINFKFGEEYIVQHLQSNQHDTTARVTICATQRLFSMLKGRELEHEDDEQSVDGLGNLSARPDPIGYNPAIPIETFDIIVADKAHRSIYNLWRQVLEHFDAYLIGLTAIPSKQTFGFFNQNLVMEYGNQKAVADGVNVNYDVYGIYRQVSEQGTQVPKYVEHYLVSRLGKTRLTKNASWAVNQASINQKDARATPNFLPDRPAQQVIVSDVDRRLSIIKETAVEVAANIKRGQALRQSTLSKAFAAT